LTEAEKKGVRGGGRRRRRRRVVKQEV